MPTLTEARLQMAAQMLRLGVTAQAWRWLAKRDDDADLIAAWAMMAAAWQAGRDAALDARNR